MNINSNKLYMEQVINESGIKGSACSKNDCMTCENLTNCYRDASIKENESDTDYGGYETETHY